MQVIDAKWAKTILAQPDGEALFDQWLIETIEARDEADRIAAAAGAGYVAAQEERKRLSARVDELLAVNSRVVEQMRARNYERNALCAAEPRLFVRALRSDDHSEGVAVELLAEREARAVETDRKRGPAAGAPFADQVELNEWLLTAERSTTAPMFSVDRLAFIRVAKAMLGITS